MKSHRALAWTACLALALACGSGEPGGAAPASAPQGSADGATAVARVGDRTISSAELDARVKEDLFEREMTQRSPSDQYELRAQAAERMVEQIALESAASARGLSIDALLKAELDAAGGVTDAEVDAFYQANRQRMPQDRTLDAMRPAIRSHLEQGKIEQIRANLRQQAKAEILLEPPRVQVSGTGHARGPEKAPVTIVEFSDYQCPFCLRAEPTVEAVLARYGDKVRLEYRHLPLVQIHPRAQPAAVAAVCAEKQGKFWEYHARLFQNQKALEEADLKKYASEVGLDGKAFDACRVQPEAAQRVSSDMEAASRAGIDGTPAFLVNGILLSGARPLEDFVRLIERELARAGG
jgi:protein-disulfide isomerase